MSAMSAILGDAPENSRSQSNLLTINGDHQPCIESLHDHSHCSIVVSMSLNDFNALLISPPYSYVI